MSKSDVRKELGLHAAKNTPADQQVPEELGTPFDRSPLSEVQGLKQIALRRFSFDPCISYFVKQ